MKLFLNCVLFLLVSVWYTSSSFSLPKKRIAELCQEEKKIKTCIKNTNFRKNILLKGKRIEIPVIPFKK